MKPTKRQIDDAQCGRWKRPPRKEVIGRAFKIIRLFESGDSFTVAEIGLELDLTYKNARAYIDAASTVMPIREVWGTYPVEFKLMRSD